MLDEIVKPLLPDTENFLRDLIRFPSVPGEEHGAIDYTAEAFDGLGLTVEKTPIPNTIRDDPDYSFPVPNLKYDNRYNLRVVSKGSQKGKSLLLNTHLDVVPASKGQVQPFEPVVENGIVRGRGACDAKGQAAVIFLVFAALQKLKTPPRGDVIAHLVVEEEVGGNGTLAMVRRGEKADAAVVLEPTALKILSSVRGAVWFRIRCEGKAGHSGQPGRSVSALNVARTIMTALEQYHSDLLKKSRGIPLFDCFENPMPLTFGRLHAGDWPAAAPNEAILEGVLGFLPNRTRSDVMAEFQAAIDSALDTLPRNSVQVEFTYRHDAHVLDTGHPLVQKLLAASKNEGIQTEISAMPASCDSWFYNNQLNIPAVVFGPGSLGVAHSAEERIALEDIATASRILLRFILDGGV